VLDRAGNSWERLAHAQGRREIRGAISARNLPWRGRSSPGIRCHRRKEGATAVSHGATGKGNDQVRFELTLHGHESPPANHLLPGKIRSGPCIPARMRLNTRASAIFPDRFQKEDLQRDGNLWHLSHEGGVLEHRGTGKPVRHAEAHRDAGNRPEKGRICHDRFRQGIPVGSTEEKKTP